MIACSRNCRSRKKGYSFLAYPVDVSDYDSCQQLAEWIRSDGACMDILVNNAGVVRDGAFCRLTKVSWDAVLRTKPDSVFNVTKPFLDGMVERGWRRFINIASINGSKGQLGQSNYAAEGRNARLHQIVAPGGCRARSRCLPRSPGSVIFRGRASATMVEQGAIPAHILHSIHMHIDS